MCVIKRDIYGCRSATGVFVFFLILVVYLERGSGCLARVYVDVERRFECQGRGSCCYFYLRIGGSL